jgi:hypothetical protein
MSIKTIQDARSLPEIESELLFESIEVVDPVTHDMQVVDIVKPLSGVPIFGDDIALFIDEDGRTMKVVHVEGGYRKVEFRL